jgi:hypothetical protein
VFLIRGGDAVGPQAVMAWADLAASMGASREIVAAARAQATAMLTWQSEHGAKVPDMP